MSAYETTGEDWSAGANKRADEALRRELHSRCSWLLRLAGCTPGGAHDEPCWAFEMPFNEACDLGLRYRQDALYAVEDGMLFVSYCDDRRALESVGKFRHRIMAERA